MIKIKAVLQFMKGIDEVNIPLARLTRSRDGSTGTATFLFENPSIFDKSSKKEGEITGLYLLDKEGSLNTKDVNARFINGKPISIEAIYIMKNTEEWDRFMRFMKRYSKENGLTFIQPNSAISV
jgi:photosystem II protein